MGSGFANAFIYVHVFVLVLVWDSEFPTIHPISIGYDVANSSTALLCCSYLMTTIAMQQPAYPIASFAGK